MKKEKEEERNGLELSWNGFISSLLEARRSWEKFSRLAEESKRELEVRGPKIQRAVDLFSKGKFEVVLPFILSYCLAQGGLEEFRVPKDQFLEEKGEKTDG